MKLVTKPIGENRTWAEMARRNASLALGQRLSAQATQEVRALSREIDAALEAAAELRNQ